MMILRNVESSEFFLCTIVRLDYIRNSNISSISICDTCHIKNSYFHKVEDSTKPNNFFSQ